eukprot:3709903-Prymnesium_polylepis.2
MCNRRGKATADLDELWEHDTQNVRAVTGASKQQRRAPAGAAVGQAPKSAALWDEESCAGRPAGTAKPAPAAAPPGCKGGNGACAARHPVPERLWEEESCGGGPPAHAARPAAAKQQRRWEEGSGVTLACRDSAAPPRVAPPRAPPPQAAAPQQRRWEEESCASGPTCASGPGGGSVVRSNATGACSVLSDSKRAHWLQHTAAVLSHAPLTHITPPCSSLQANGRCMTTSATASAW